MPIKQFSGQLSTVFSHRGNNDNSTKYQEEGSPKFRSRRCKWTWPPSLSLPFALIFSKRGVDRAKPTFMPLFTPRRKECQCLVCLDSSRAENEAIENLPGARLLQTMLHKIGGMGPGGGARWEDAAAGRAAICLFTQFNYACSQSGKADLFIEQNIDSLLGT